MLYTVQIGPLQKMSISQNKNNYHLFFLNFQEAKNIEQVVEFLDCNLATWFIVFPKSPSIANIKENCGPHTDSRDSQPCFVLPCEPLVFENTGMDLLTHLKPSVQEHEEHAPTQALGSSSVVCSSTA